MVNFFFETNEKYMAFHFLTNMHCIKNQAIKNIERYMRGTLTNPFATLPCDSKSHLALSFELSV